MWKVYEAKTAVKNINKLPGHILEKYEFWRSVAHISGPEGVRLFPGFKDHGLKGEWQGFRSSCLNDAFRVIYRIDKAQVSVYVVDVNHHDYRRK
jgi:addiction module RelE/StbE family toxin